MKLSKRNINLLMVFLGLVIFLAAYLLVKPYEAKTQELRDEIAALEPRLAELREYEANRPVYEAGMDASIKNVEAELKKYPNDIRSEDLIMFAVGFRDEIKLEVGSISFSQPELVSRFQIVTEGENGAEFVPMAAMRRVLTAGCEMDYVQLKRFLDYIYQQPYSTMLESISISYNSSSGKLLCSADISKYFVSTNDYTYYPTEVPDVPLGTNDPFQTFRVLPENGGN